MHAYIERRSSFMSLQPEWHAAVKRLGTGGTSYIAGMFSLTLSGVGSSGPCCRLSGTGIRWLYTYEHAT